MRKSTFGASLVTLAMGGSACLLGANAHADDSHVYEHGLFAQSHWSTANACNQARSNVLAALARNHIDLPNAGNCHPITVTSTSHPETGWIYDVTYVASNPLWSTDRDLGTTPTAGAANHSFSALGFADSQAEAQSDQKDLQSKIQAGVNTKITWTSDVQLNALTKKWGYEVDYDSRVPVSTSDIEMSESAGITAPSLGVKSVVPTAPTDKAKKDGVTAPGQASMGWTSGATKGSTTATPPKGPVTTTTTKTSGSTTATTTTKSSSNGSVVSTTTTKTPTTTTKTDNTIGIQGIDISQYTSVSDWAGWNRAGVKFMWIKASEGNYYTNSRFNDQYQDAANHNVLRGAYDFANPAVDTGTAEADYFIAHGGGWSGDGKTLPGALDMEWNPYGTDACYGLNQSQMNNWVRSFIAEYKAKEGTNPIIYTAVGWWNQCVGASSYNDIPLWLAQYSASVQSLPQAWRGSTHLFWQNSDGNGHGYDTDIFNGTIAQLQRYATNGLDPRG